MASQCLRCGSDAAMRCGGCRSVWYCARDCQIADRTRHRPQCRDPSIFPAMHLLPADFFPQSYLFCLHCEKHFMMCQCVDLAHGQDMFFVMDPIPEHFTVMQRIRRWASLILLHPRLSSFDAGKFVNDLPASFEADLRRTMPVIQNLMEQYKATAMATTCAQLGIVCAEGRQQCHRDCDYAIEHFFQGNWGYPTMMEYTFLNNAVQMSGPEDFEGAMRASVQNVFQSFSTILGMFGHLGQGKLNYRLEDLRNGQRT